MALVSTASRLRTWVYISLRDPDCRRNNILAPMVSVGTLQNRTFQN